jgi:hypothetical protein
MAIFRFLRRLYSLDILDTRLTNTSSRDPKAGQRVEASSSSPVRKPAQQGTNPSKWNTPEFYFYYLVFLAVIPIMFKSVYDVSKGKLFKLHGALARF